MAVFEGKKSSNDLIINDTMSDDELVASDVPPRYLFLEMTLLPLVPLVLLFLLLLLRFSPSSLLFLHPLLPLLPSLLPSSPALLNGVGGNVL